MKHELFQIDLTLDEAERLQEKYNFKRNIVKNQNIKNIKF